MAQFTQIPQDTFDQLQMDAGVLLSKFDPTKPEAMTNQDIITATTGGVNVVCQPTISDLGEDVDNCPANTKELAHLDSWTCTISTTALGTDAKTIRLALGAADINAETSAIIPRKDLAQGDFTDLWWVGQKANGGFVAVQLLNALSTEGFSLQTTKNGKGQTSLTLTGYVSIDKQDEVPMKFYSVDKTTTTDSGNAETPKSDTGTESQSAGAKKNNFSTSTTTK